MFLTKQNFYYSMIGQIKYYSYLDKYEEGKKKGTLGFDHSF